MFDRIAPSYDLLNHLLSLNIDKAWRRLLSRRAAALHPGRILDVATGTADLAILLARTTDAAISGIDLSEGMLRVGREKVIRHRLEHRVSLSVGDAMDIPFPDNSFDIVSVAFGVRNFHHTVDGLSEMGRVLRAGGKTFILEFSAPTGFFGHLARFYMRIVMPIAGRLISGHPTAYTYLPETALAFPEGEAFASLLREAGFVEVSIKALTFGIATLYEASKPPAK